MGSSTASIPSVMAAAAQSVAKVFCIGLVGSLVVLVPRKRPFLPSSAVATVARFSFHTNTLSLIFSTTAVSIHPDSMRDYWFLVVAALCVIGLSYLVSTVLGKYLCIGGLPAMEFQALRVAAAFPNIVALPILIFPSLCEHSIVYENFILGTGKDDSSDIDLRNQCSATANSMIFVYFFGWSLCFWTFGHPQLMQAAHAKELQSTTMEMQLSKSMHSAIPHGDKDDTGSNVEGANMGRGEDEAEDSSQESHSTESRKENDSPSLLQAVLHALKQTCTSPGFIALAAGIVTGCIRPLQEAMMQPGGPLRFLGDAVQTMGVASSSMSTMIVAASLVPAAWTQDTEQSLWSLLRSSLRRGQSADTRTAAQRSEHYRLLVWYIVSRLFVTPAVVVTLIAFLPLRSMVPPMALLVVIVNSALPGALIVVVLLKGQGLSTSAQTVASVYLPSYLISILSIAAWTAIGLWLTLPE